MLQSKEALFRYQIVAQVRSRMLAGESQAEAVRAVARVAQHFAPSERPRRVSPRSIYRWLSDYREGGLERLERTPLPQMEAPSKVLSPSLLEFMREEKKKDSKASVPELIRRARKLGHLGEKDPCSRVTVYRALRRLGISLARRKKAKERDARRFAYPHRMEMILSDGKHFRAGRGRVRRMAYFFLDDATRFALHVVVGTSENAELFLRGLYEMVSKHGLFNAIYLDQGPGFIADDTVTVVGNLPALLITGETAYPEGHGKIERFNRTALSDVLRGFSGRPDVDPELRALELRLRHYLESEYNPRAHESLKGESPFTRFMNDERSLRFPEDMEALRRKFEISFTRRVSSDNVVSIDSVHHEIPRGYATTKVTLRRRILDGGKIFFLHEGRLQELHPVDLESNARSPRAKGHKGDDEVAHPLPPSAADLAFERDYGPVVNPDGDCPDCDSPSDPAHQEEAP